MCWLTWLADRRSFCMCQSSCINNRRWQPQARPWRRWNLAVSSDRLWWSCRWLLCCLWAKFATDSRVDGGWRNGKLHNNKSLEASTWVKNNNYKDAYALRQKSFSPAIVSMSDKILIELQRLLSGWILADRQTIRWSSIMSAWDKRIGLLWNLFSGHGPVLSISTWTKLWHLLVGLLHLHVAHAVICQCTVPRSHTQRQDEDRVFMVQVWCIQGWCAPQPQCQLSRT